jgi:MFS family permease
MELPRALTPFRHGAYRRLAVALVLSLFANGVWVIALVWEVIRMGGGPAELSLVSTAGAVGVLLPALVSGAIADRIPQKRILLAVASAEAVGMGIIAILSLAGLTEFWHLAAVSFAAGLGMAFYYPAYSAWLPALVPAEDLLAVNGFEGMVRPSIHQVLGPAVAGIVVGVSSPGVAAAIAAIASLAGLLALTFVPVTPVRRDLSANRPSVLGDVREGFAYMVRTPWLLATLLFASLLILLIMGPIEVLTPFLVKDRLGGDAGSHAAVLAAWGIGGALGSLAMASRRMPRRYLTFMLLGWGLGCLPIAVIGFASQIWMVVLGAFVAGAMFSAPQVVWGTLLQRRVPGHLLGRVASLDFFVSMSLMPVSMALAGPVSVTIGLQETFLVAGVIPIFLAVIAIVWAKMPSDELAHPLRDMGRTDIDPGHGDTNDRVPDDESGVGGILPT